MVHPVHQPVIALSCPACGGPLTGHAAQSCGFCGVALIVPDGVPVPTPGRDADRTYHELARLRERLRADPSRAETHRRLGQIYETLGLTDDAVRALTVAVGLAPEHTGFRLELATLLASRSAAGVPDAFPAAMRHVKHLLALAPDSTGALLLLARLQTQRGDFDAARATLGRIAALPDDEVRRRTAWVTLAEAAARDRRGDRTGAVAGWRQVAVDAPDLARPAVVGFLDRTASAHRVIARTRARRSRGWSSGPVPSWLRPVLATVAAALSATAVITAGLTWLVALALACVALVPLLWLPGNDHHRDARTLAGRHDPGTSLDELLALATRVAAAADALAQSRRRAWADNLALEIPESDGTRLTAHDGRSRAVQWPSPCDLPERTG